MNSHLSQLDLGLLSALDRQIDRTGRLFDPLDDAPTPSDHYGQCSAALARACDLRHLDRMDRALVCVQNWASQPFTSRGHQPFNRLLLRLIQLVWPNDCDEVKTPQELDSLATGCALAAIYPSNNWALLAQLVRLLEASDSQIDAVRNDFCAMLERWTTPAGGFIDFPRNPKPGARVSTPIAYHHKALLLTAIATRLHPHPSLFKHLHRLVDWLAYCWDPAGYAGGLGRSNHALFGDACLIGALILLGQDHDESDCVNALVHRLQRQVRSDGLLWLDPFGPAEGKANWDAYMHLSVYNAWFAAIVGVCRQLGCIDANQLTEFGVEWRGDTPGIFHDEQAGVLCARRLGGMNILFSTRGQLPQATEPGVADLRYAGGVPVHATDATGRLVIRPPERHDCDRLAANPKLAAPVEVLFRGEALYGLTDFDEIDIRATGSNLSIRLRGRPTALTRPVARALLGRIAAAIDWRFLGGRIGRWQASRRPQMTGVWAELEWELGLDEPRFEKRFRTVPG